MLERQGDLIRFHNRILELAGHYHFAPKPVAVARGNEKGRTERRIRDIRESFFAARTYASLSDLNRQLDTWVDRVVHQRRVPGESEKLVVQALVEEQPRLLKLPEHQFQAESIRVTSSGKTPYLRFDKNDYSIPHKLIRKPLTVVASESLVRVLDGEVEIARHPRSWGVRQQIEDEAHLAALLVDKRKSREHRGRNRLFAGCPAAQPFLGEVAKHSGHLGGTTSRLLRLLDQYGATELDAALADAHQFREPSGAPFKYVAIEPDESIHSFLVELAKQRGLLITNAPDGSMLFWKSRPGGVPVVRFEEGTPPLTSVRATFSPQDYYSHITGFIPAKNRKAGSTYTVPNKFAGKYFRPHACKFDDTERGDAPAATNAKMGRMLANAVSYVIEDLPTWRDPEAKLWSPNTTLTALAPSAMIYKESS